MGIIYPDNQNRANRVEQLAVNIGSIQSEVDDSLDRVDTNSNHQTDAVNAIFKLEGFKGIDELKKQLDAVLTPEQRAAYQASVDHIRNKDEITDKILDASLIVSFISGAAGLSAAPIARILSTGALAAGADLFGRGFRAMLAGDAMGVEMMAGAYRTFRALRTGGEVSETATRVTRYIRTASTVLAVLGVVLDGVVLIYQAVEGAKQKTELQNGINELCARRFMAKTIEDQTFATESYVGQVSAFLITYQVLKQQGYNEEAIKTTMDLLLKNVTENLTADLAKITDDAVWKQCADIDKQMGNAWTNEDPSLQWVQSWVAAQPPAVPDEETQSHALMMHKAIQAAKVQVKVPNRKKVAVW